MMMMICISRGGEGLEVKNEDSKATRSKGMGLEESASARSCARIGGKDEVDVVGEVKGVDVMGV